MALIFTPSLSQTHFCKSDNCGISKVTCDSDLICQILTLTLYSLMKILFTLIKFRNLYRVFKSFLSEISTAATVPSKIYHLNKKIKKTMTSFKQIARHKITMVFFEIKSTCPSNFLKNIT
jgi:hypothetical protein